MEAVEAIVDCVASVPVVGKRLPKKLGVWKRARKVHDRQSDGSHLSGGNFIVNTSFKQLHPVEYQAKTLSGAQRTWLIHAKELFPIVDSFWKWRDWLVGVEVNF